jgi:YggT family protein
MLNDIVSLLLKVAAGLLTGVCLLRLYMQHQRIPMSARSGNPMGPFMFALTDWLVLPLRRLLPAIGRWDTASLVAAFLAQVVLFGAQWLMPGHGAGWIELLVEAVFGVAITAIQGLSGLLIVYAMLSWVQTQSYLSDLMERLVAPLLTPIRKLIPLVGGVDLSPLVLLLLLQIALIVLGHFIGSVLIMAL